MNPYNFNRDAGYAEIKLPVAPACNVMCNFCSKNSDCLCNGNDPGFLSRPMTPRQAVERAVASVSGNRHIKVVRIAGPGEPLYNSGTFEVLKRLKAELPGFKYAVNTNGLLLEEKCKELISYQVSSVEVSVNAFFDDTITKLYSRIIKDKDVVSSRSILPGILFSSQIDGIGKCIGNGIAVKLNTVFFPEINRRDIPLIALKLSKLGVKSMRIISGMPGGKFARLRMPSIKEMDSLRRELREIIPDVELHSFSP